MTGRFTFVVSEKEASILLDAVEQSMVCPPTDSVFSQEDFAEVAAMLAERLAW